MDLEFPKPRPSIRPNTNRPKKRFFEKLIPTTSTMKVSALVHILQRNKAALFISVAFIWMFIMFVFNPMCGVVLKDILIEANGMVFDLFVFGALLSWYEIFNEKRDKIERYKEEIDDFRNWNTTEARIRIVGIIKRLNKLGVTNVSLEECSLSSVDLRGVDLSSASLYCADLSNATLIYGSLIGADLTFATLKGAEMAHVDLSWADLREANLSEVDLTFSNLYRAKFTEANLHKANLKGAYLNDADFVQANLHEVDLTEADLYRANLTDVGLIRANLKGAKLNWANLSRAYLKDADLSDANLSNANLSGANLSGANLKNVILTIEQLALSETLFNCKNLHDSIKIPLQKKHPHLFQPPKEVQEE
jgi:uncharacterized protein YjbI with pentapeptide repeats